MMNITDARNHDWRGVAGAMGMSTEEVRQLEGAGEAKGRMTGLFDIMIQTKKSVKDLLELMKNTDVQRLDVADEICKGCKLPAEDVMETDSAETQVSGQYTFFLCLIAICMFLIKEGKLITCITDHGAPLHHKTLVLLNYM